MQVRVMFYRLGTIGEPRQRAADLSFIATGLEIHNKAQTARRSIARDLKESTVAAMTIRLPADYWWCACIEIERESRGISPHKHPGNAAVLIQYICLLVESTWQDFREKHTVIVEFNEAGPKLIAIEDGTYASVEHQFPAITAPG